MCAHAYARGRAWTQDGGSNANRACGGGCRAESYLYPTIGSATEISALSP
jgi:hypothetical protein